MKLKTTLWIVLLGVAGGCGWFDTREPSPVTPEPPVPWESPIEPETVLANMDSALVYLGRGITNYSRCYADTFHFYPTANDRDVIGQQGKPTAFDDFTKTVEEEVMDLLLNSSTRVEVTWTPDEVIVDTEEHKVWEERYHLLIEYLSGAVETYEGIARLELRVDPDQANQWFITSWQDFFFPNQPDTVYTWGYLRGQRRQI
jgi:hypothetical protein